MAIWYALLCSPESADAAVDRGSWDRFWVKMSSAYLCIVLYILTNIWPQFKLVDIWQRPMHRLHRNWSQRKKRNSRPPNDRVDVTRAGNPYSSIQMHDLSQSGAPLMCTDADQMNTLDLAPGGAHSMLAGYPPLGNSPVPHPSMGNSPVPHPSMGTVPYPPMGSTQVIAPVGPSRPSASGNVNVNANKSAKSTEKNKGKGKKGKQTGRSQEQDPANTSILAGQEEAGMDRVQHEQPRIEKRVKKQFEKELRARLTQHGDPSAGPSSGARA